MAERRLCFSEHAVDRMLEQAIEVDDVEDALDHSEIVEDYEDGSRLVLNPRQNPATGRLDRLDEDLADPRNGSAAPR